MARFYQGEDGEYRFEEGEYDVELHESNLSCYTHREEPLKDMAAVLDERDDQHWIWFRFDQGDEVFDEIVFMARAVGTYVHRTRPFQDLETKFDARHQFTDDDYTHLLEEPDVS